MTMVELCFDIDIDIDIDIEFDFGPNRDGHSSSFR
jgi:hypothetical protein